MRDARRREYTRDSRGDEVTAYYSLDGQFDPDEITQRVNIRPTFACRIGDVINQQSGMPAAIACWEITPILPSPSELEDHIAAVLATLEPAFAEFCALGRSYDATIACVVMAYGAQAGQHFEREHVRQAGLLNAAIDLDLYALWEPEQEAKS